jgi:SAM-dependent methyltransferase
MPFRTALYSASPFAYRLFERMYRGSALARRRQVRAQTIMAAQIAKRIDREVGIFNAHLDGDLTVQHGPFAGMRYFANASGSVLGPKIVGSYESQIHPWIADAISKRFARIVDIGCAEGFYAVGLALKSTDSEVFAFDTNSAALKLLEQLAGENGARGRITLGARCSHADLRRICSTQCLVFCDIEGAELDLLRIDRVPELMFAHMIVETHDSQSPGITLALTKRFLATHKVEIVYHEPKEPKDYPALARMPEEDARFLIDERRSSDQCWMRLTPYERNQNPSGNVANARE